MNRRDFIKAASVGCLSSVFGGALAWGRGRDVGRRLNVLLVMMDQHHHAIMGCAGNSVVKTPNLDRLARQGVRFTNAVCATTYCSPARAALVTGRWPHSTGIVNNCKPQSPALKSDKDTTEGMLSAAGYATEQIGKWHLGTKSDLQCYRKSLSSRDRSTAHRDMLKRRGFKAAAPRAGEKFIEKAGVYATDWNYRAWERYHAEQGWKGQDLMAIGRQAVPAELELWGAMADDGVAWLKSNRNRNFMLTYSAGPPHALWVAPDPWYSMYDPAKVPVPKTLGDPVPQAYVESSPAQKGRHLGEKGFREMIRVYYAQVTMIDAYIGRLLDALDETGLSENTLVIYLSDHGDMQGSHGGMLGKSVGAFYEEIVRVPMIMRLPGVIEAGKVVNVHANSVDLLPTIMDYLQMPIPEAVQGRSLRPIIEGSQPDEVGYGFSERPGGRMVRSADMKYCVYFGDEGKREELFDLAGDPSETTNLAGVPKYAKQKAKMLKVLRRHLKETEDSPI